ncbi:hypothetical protein P8H27_02090 [Pseudomonas sp. sp1636]|uniref:hypothetical protein n=1 Tax=Pseudomonas sp. sp1636 TaxID=3036707 RepID=UPI0025A55051|nr:hypothetical protein [Pseudomonas sp. sp1636]MDM8347686.1 hypothetical protein [Pseudomonas sp. sp1636]
MKIICFFVAALTATAVATSAVALGEFTGSEQSVGSSKVDACSSAKNKAASEAQYEVKSSNYMGQLDSKKYNIKVEGCMCEKTSTGAICSATWSINFEN